MSMLYFTYLVGLAQYQDLSLSDLAYIKYYRYIRDLCLYVANHISC